MADMKIKKICAAVLALGGLAVATGCNVVSFFPHKAAEAAADKVIDDTLPRDSASAPTRKAANAASPTAPQK